MITFREMRDDDIPVLADMVWKRWARSDTKKKPEVAVHYGYQFIYYALAFSSVGFVADDDGKPSGLLILDIKDNHPVKIEYLLKMFEHMMAFSSDPEGYKNEQDWLALEKNYKNSEKLLEGKNIGAEVVLFINDENHRRQGVGSRMFHHMADYLHEKGVKDFYLHTDQCSNHEFYLEKRHMQEFNKRSSDVTVGDIENATLYIYVDDVENQRHD